MKQLFIDDHIVEEIDNLARKLHQLNKFERNVVVRPEYRWENCLIQLRTPPVWVPEEGIFKMLYFAAAEGPDPEVKLDAIGEATGGESFTCYATSTDGVNWEKPFLGLYDYPVLTWTGKPIGKARLVARPWAPYGIEYARMVEKGLVRAGERIVTDEEPDEEEEDAEVEPDYEPEDGGSDRDDDETGFGE